MAFMVYLGALTVAGFLIVQQVTSSWERSIGGGVTVHLPFIGSDAGADGKVSSALDIFRATPGVASAELVSNGKMFALKLSPAHRLATPAAPFILTALTLMTARVTVRRFLAAHG